MKLRLKSDAGALDLVGFCHCLELLLRLKSLKETGNLM
jgi:hypothetical protein